MKKNGKNNIYKQSHVPFEISYLIKLFLACLIIFTLLRAGLLLRNFDIAKGIPLKTIGMSFLVGARFDVVITSYLLFPLVLWSLIPKYGWQYKAQTHRFLPLVVSLFWSPLIFLGMAEFEFYREFHDRFNQLAINYFLDDHVTVISMIWNGYPVIPYLLLWLVMTFTVWFILKRLTRQIPAHPVFEWRAYFRKVIPAGTALIVLIVFGTRGGFQKGPPLRWGDAFFSDNTFANHLALNGIFTLSRALLELNRDVKFYTDKLPEEDAVLTARKLVVQPGDDLISPEKYVLFRYPGGSGRTLTYNQTPKNIVLVIMESFSSEVVDAMGSRYHATPNFDRISQKGVLFDRFFSQGTHTHQGIFATVCSFPNLPGFEYLMKNNHGQQPFRSFISLLREEDFQSIYIYNGSFTWDNQEGFFRNQGMRNFVGRYDYINPKYTDVTWGVSDEDMFMRGIEEIRKLTEKGRTFALLQTVSNHPPFDLPPPAPFPELHGPEQLVPRLNGMRYSDWALGKFFERAERETWFSHTLFVIVGDHGFSYEAPKAMMNLSSYHVPLLIYYPGDTEKGGQVNHTVSSQVDVLPTVMGLMGIHNAYQAWGRDLFRLDPSDQGWAVIKPSGGHETVGFIRGDILFVTAPKIAPSVYRYRLNPWDATKIQMPAETASEFTQNLYGYVQSGIKALLTYRAGVSAEDLPIMKK